MIRLTMLEDDVDKLERALDEVAKLRTAIVTAAISLAVAALMLAANVAVFT